MENMNAFRLWNEDGLDYIFFTSADRNDVADAIAYVEENVENCDNESVTARLEELGFMVVVQDEIPEENTFYW